MVCPYRKMTETVDDTTREYYMECYGTECPFYVQAELIGTKDYCNRADTDVYIATHMKGIIT